MRQLSRKWRERRRRRRIAVLPPQHSFCTHDVFLALAVSWCVLLRNIIQKRLVLVFFYPWDAWMKKNRALTPPFLPFSSCRYCTAVRFQDANVYHCVSPTFSQEDTPGPSDNCSGNISLGKCVREHAVPGGTHHCNTGSNMAYTKTFLTRGWEVLIRFSPPTWHPSYPARYQQSNYQILLCTRVHWLFTFWAIKTVTEVSVDGAYKTLTLKNRQKTFSHLTNMKEIDNR